jgi:hypothetical protein
MTISADVKILRVGVEGLNEPIAAPLAASVTVYSGTIALSASGYLKGSNTAPASTDKVLGVVDLPTGGTYVKTGPGITAGSTDGSVWVDCQTGTFLFLSGTGSDALVESDAGATVYVVDAITVGKTNGGGTRPTAGVMLPIDPTIPTGYVPVKLASPAS